MAKILLADDDRIITEQVSRWLQTVEGHIVETVSDGKEALDRLKLYDYDLVILDWNMPNGSGIDVCRSFRANRGNLPILMLTANSALSDKEIGFNTGADDYLTKPFDLKELSLRVKALLRRPAQLRDPVYEVGEIRLDTNKKQVYKCGKLIELTPREYVLLEVLMKADGRFLTAEEIANKIWTSESDASPLAVKTVVSRLKSKLCDTAQSLIIHNVHGRGYCVRSPEENV